MALRRQALSQRRKAVGFTQESLAEHLGVERSTIVRWEAGDTEPLPSIRPDVARALQVSIDQLAELLTESENADTTRALSAGTEVTIPVLLPEVQSQMQPGRAEFEDLIHPQVAETVEALRRALHSAGVGLEELSAMLLAGGSSRGSDVVEPTRTEVPHRPSLTAIPLDVEAADVQQRRARSRRLMWFTAAGVLVLAGGAASVPFVTSHSGPTPPAVAGTPAPEDAIPAPDAGSGNDNSPRSADFAGAVPTTPSAAANTPADGPATPGAAVVSAPRTTRATIDSRITSRSKPREVTTPPPPPRTPAWATEAAAVAGHVQDGVGGVEWSR